jgi:hypothetical protein
MTVTESNEDRIRRAFATPNEHARRKALLELLVDMQPARQTTGPEIDALVEGMRHEESSLVLSSIWGYFSRHPHDTITRYATEELTSADETRRSYAVYYLGHALPEERRKLFDRMESDADPLVLYEVGRLLMDEDPRAAVEVWRRAMYDAETGLADETLAPLVGQYADDEVIAELKRDAARPYDELARVALWQASKWRSVDYLDAKGPVPPGAGYCFNCPNCSRTVCVRAGHEGERARCHECGTVFTIPPAST